MRAALVAAAALAAGALVADAFAGLPLALRAAAVFSFPSTLVGALQGGDSSKLSSLVPGLLEFLGGFVAQGGRGHMDRGWGGGHPSFQRLAG